MKISVIIPFRNEEKYIKDCITSLIDQQKTNFELEFIFVDGFSNDNTTKIINEIFQNINIPYKIIINEQKIQSISMNKGFEISTGDIIVRCDAHSIYPHNFLKIIAFELHENNKEFLTFNTETIGNNNIQEIIASIMSSPIGMGSSGHRTNNLPSKKTHGYLSAVKKDTINKYGYFKPLAIGEDYEFAIRLIKNGVNHYRYPVKIKYHPRDSIKGYLKQMYSYGYGKWDVYFKYKLSIKIRNVIPIIFVVYIYLLITTWHTYMYYIPFYIYIGTIIISATKYLKNKNKTYNYLMYCVLVALAHISYGIGAITRIIKNEVSHNIF